MFTIEPGGVQDLSIALFVILLGLALVKSYSLAVWLMQWCKDTTSEDLDAVRSGKGTAFRH